MSRDTGPFDIARAVTSAVRRADDLRKGRFASSDSAADDQPGTTNAVFLRGIALGALVGAAIAGSTIWERRKTRERIKRELLDEAETAAS